MDPKNEYTLGEQICLEKINQQEFRSNLFGNWIEQENLDKLRNEYQNTQPFSHVVIPHFMESSLAEKIHSIFPSSTNSGWFLYFNPIEHKMAMNDISLMPKEIIEIIEMLNHQDFIRLISYITNINNLEADPYLHGGGLHSYPHKGKLNMHLDYSIHPMLHKERRLNLIIYVNKNWNQEWGGNLELWDNVNHPKIIKEISVDFNTAVLFKTNDNSFHGIPKPINCPSDKFRRSIAVYYISEPRENIIQRSKAHFYITDEERKNDEKLKQLIEIRNNRRIRNSDLETIYPEWKEIFY
jgi:Rps23 Pro-64 3,4-dihydroxylase Tpa1-like proline 4-hydroxylase